jgi:hypothetical protein
MLTSPWLRIGVGALLILSAVANLRKGVFEWAPFLCLGLMFLLGVDRRQGESLTSYFRNPRSIAATLFGAGALVGCVHNIYILSAH